VGVAPLASDLPASRQNGHYQRRQTNCNEVLLETKPAAAIGILHMISLTFT
jgi:hypothetical protein